MRRCDCWKIAARDASEVLHRLMLRFARWAWPSLLFIPLTPAAGRGCQFVGVDSAYHSMLWIHENLAVLYVAAAVIAAVAVALRVARARARAGVLFSLATSVPERIESAFVAEAGRLSVNLPRIAYLDVAVPLCFVLVGTQPAVVLSRGFIEDLEADEVRMVARHELLHVRHRDPERAFVWHLVFAALLVPGFSDLERWFATRRELRTNLAAAESEPHRYGTLLASRARGQRSLCIGGFGASERRWPRLPVFARPAIGLLMFAGLALSHASFLDHLAFLSAHHC